MDLAFTLKAKNRKTISVRRWMLSTDVAIKYLPKF